MVKQKVSFSRYLRKSKQVQDYYAQELMTPADRKAMLESYLLM